MDFKENNFSDIQINIDGFDFINKRIDDKQNTIWKYTKKEDDYFFNLFIAQTKNKRWYYKIFVYWKEKSKEYTNGKGKDFDRQFGPYDSKEEMYKNLETSVRNIVLQYHDNNNRQLDEEIFNMIEKLKNHIEDLDKSNNDYFLDLKKEIPNLFKSKEEVQKYLDEKWPTEEDKQQLLLVIQKMNRVKNLNQIDSIKSLF